MFIAISTHPVRTKYKAKSYQSDAMAAVTQARYSGLSALRPGMAEMMLGVGVAVTGAQQVHSSDGSQQPVSYTHLTQMPLSGKRRQRIWLAAS